MKNLVSCYTIPIIAYFEQFALNFIEELRQYVIYTYYDEYGNTLYVGSSADFYNAHYFNSKRFEWFQNVKYIGFIFLNNEKEIHDLKKYYVKSKKPLYNKHQYKKLSLSKEETIKDDYFIVLKDEMELMWNYFLGVVYYDEDEYDEKILEFQTLIDKINKDEEENK